MKRVATIARKLRGRAPAELRGRAGQALAIWLERAHLDPDARALDFAALRRRLDPTAFPRLPGTTEELHAHFHDRRAPDFFGGFEDRRATLAALRRHWPASEAATIAAAERLRAGRFDLLGQRGISFGEPIDWQHDPVRRVRVPSVHWSRVRHMDSPAGGDHKLVWELNRQQYLLTLGRAYWYTGDESYAGTAARHLSAWLDANPPKLGLNWESSLEIAFRSISWLWALAFFRGSAHFSPRLLRRMLAVLYLNGRHVERHLSTYFSPNTHLTGEALGLFYLGTLLPELRAARRWHDTGWRVLTEQLSRQLHPDGVYFEQASYYQRYTLDIYLHALILAERNGGAVPAGMREGVSRAATHLMYLTQPDGSSPLIGDDDGGRLTPLDASAPDDFRPALATAAAVLERGELAFVAGPAAEETLWLLGPAGLARYETLERRPPALASRAFPDGGYYIMRDGWRRDASVAVIDCGPHGTMNCGHAHADALALDIASGGRSVLVDAGTFTYMGSAEERDRYRSSAAHNTLTVDAESSSVPAGPFAWRHIASCTPLAWISSPRFDYFDGSHDGFGRLREPAVHRRSVLFLKGDYWLARDRIESAGRHAIAAHWHLAPGLVAERRPDGSIAARDGVTGQAVLELAAFGEQIVSACEESWVSPSFGVRVRAPACRFSTEGTGPQQIATFLVPPDPGAPETRVVPVDAAGGQAFTVSGGAWSDTLLLSAGAEVAAAGIRSDAEIAWVRRRADGGPDEFLLIGGRSLAIDGVRVVQSDSASRFVAGHRAAGGWQIERGEPASAPAYEDHPEDGA